MAERSLLKKMPFSPFELDFCPFSPFTKDFSTHFAQDPVASTLILFYANAGAYIVGLHRFCPILLIAEVITKIGHEPTSIVMLLAICSEFNSPHLHRIS